MTGSYIQCKIKYSLNILFEQELNKNTSTTTTTKSNNDDIITAAVTVTTKTLTKAKVSIKIEASTKIIVYQASFPPMGIVMVCQQFNSIQFSTDIYKTITIITTLPTTTADTG